MRKIIVEYSQSQQAFHVTTPQERVANERLCAIYGIISDYRQVATFETREAADEYIDHCREIQEAQEA